jgi:AcrR family transcriptional regulator
MIDPAAPGNRRAEYAQATRLAIISAARELFVRKGFFGTTVGEIAKAARVAPATVYAVGGGKQGLLRTIIEAGASDPAHDEFFARIDAEEDPVAVLRQITRTTRDVFAQWSDLMRVVTATAPHEESAARSLEIARQSQRGGFRHVAERLNALGALRCSVDDAVDVLWFYLGNASYFTLTDDNQWSLERAESWLYESLRRSLL